MLAPIARVARSNDVQSVLRCMWRGIWGFNAYQQTKALLQDTPRPIRIVKVSQRLGHTMWVGILVSNSSTPLPETRAQTPNPGEAPHRQGAPIVGAAGCKQGDFGSSGGVLRVWALKP